MGQVAAQVSDDFEDNSINTSLWSVGGRRYSWTPSDQGSWTYSQDETHDPGDPDGYLRLRVSGPYTANSYGALSWVRTNYNFNDGSTHLLNFKWKPWVTVNDDHNNDYFIQITDRDPPSFAEQNFLGDWQSGTAAPPGTKALLWSRNNLGIWEPRAAVSNTERLDPLQTTNPYTWSATIDPVGIARLYDGPNATGPMLREESLAGLSAWYFRFAVLDATSGGFGAGDIQLDLYSFSAVPEPSTLTLLGVGAASLLAYAWRRRRRARLAA